MVATCCMDEGDEVLVGWTIYSHPADFPRHIAVRQWWVSDMGLVHRPIVTLCETLDEAREQIPAGAICFPRDPDDDPVVTETWM